MEPVETPIPQRARAALGTAAPTSLWALGNPALLAGPPLGLLASREFPGRVLLDTLFQPSSTGVWLGAESRDS